MKKVWHYNSHRQPIDFWDYHNLLEETNYNLISAFNIAKEEVKDDSLKTFLNLLAAYVYEMVDQEKKIEIPMIKRLISNEFGSLEKMGFKSRKISELFYQVKGTLIKYLCKKDYEKVERALLRRVEPVK